MDRAYSTLEIKSFDAEQRRIQGLATTPTPDRGGDTVDPLGAEFTLPMPLLWQHDATRPIGEVTAAEVTPAGILITAQLAKVDEPGTLHDRLEEAWQSIRARLVRGLSIGFKVIDAAPRKKSDPFGGLQIRRWLWAETSAVTIPQNLEATIMNIKSAIAPGRPSAAMQKTYSEQIADFDARRSLLLSQMDALITAGGMALDEEQTKSYQTWSDEVHRLDPHLARLRDLEALEATKALPIRAPGAPTPAPVVTVRPNVEKGTSFIRYAMALVNGKGDSMRALEFAKQFRDSTPIVEHMVKAAVLPGDTATPAWAGVLVQVRQATDEWLELLRPRTILGRISGFRRVPFNTQMVIQTGGGTYEWVGQGAAKPVGALALDSARLDFSKAAGIIVITEELARLSSPSAEAMVRDDMIRGMAAFLDVQLIDPAVAAVTGVSPASITNGADTAASSDVALTDLGTIAGYFATNGIALGGVHLIMNETNALMMGMKRDALGNRLFPGMTAEGGTAEGLTVIGSNAAGTNVVAVQPEGVLYADDGGVNIDVSREASVMMDDAGVVGTTALTSLWQHNLVGLRAERMINWKRARPKSVYYLTGAAYTA